MAAKNENPFTNTRLMLAGLVVGVIGVILAFTYIQNVINKTVGDEVYAYYLIEDLPAGMELKSTHVRKDRIRRDLYEKMPQIIIDDPSNNDDKLLPLITDTANRDLHKGEPLLASAFSRASAASVVTDSMGKDRVRTTINLSKSAGNPGQSLAIGSVITIRGTINYQEGNRQASEPVTLVRNVRVNLINGRDDPQFRTNNVTSVAIMVSEGTSSLLNKLMASDEVSITAVDMVSSTTESQPNSEIPPDTINRLKDRGYVTEKWLRDNKLIR